MVIKETDKYVLISKETGETPLESLERFRATRKDLKDVPLTYAGRLDPLASGQLLILIGDECKNKEKYLGLDKEYEIEIVCGIKTDSHDALGIPTLLKNIEVPSDFNTYIGKFKQEYPVYSSKAVKGKQLHELARAGELPEEMPTKDVEIYSIELISKTHIPSQELNANVIGLIGKVNGDFRQKQIIDAWNNLLTNTQDEFPILKIRVRCSSGTYMRSLAHKIGGFAVNINRTNIFL